MVSPRPISVGAISTGIAPEQKTTEETPWTNGDMVRMLRRQVLRTCAGKDQRGILSPRKWRKETSHEMAQMTPGAGTAKKIRYREDTAGEGGERKNTTRCRSLTEANPGPVGRKATITGKGRKDPTGASKLPDHDRTNARRNLATSPHGRGIWFQPSEVEERVGYQKTSERGAQAQEPQPPKGTQKSWAEVVGSGQIASWDGCWGRRELMSQIVTKQGRFHMTNIY